MIFKDGLRKAGFFSDNIYQKPLQKISEFETFEKSCKTKIPEAFRQEIKEYVGLLAPDEDNSKFIGQELGEVDQEDLMATNQFQNMQEMANAPFGPGGLSKEEYAKQVAALEEAERKL